MEEAAVEAELGRPQGKIPQPDSPIPLEHWIYEFPESTNREVGVYALEFATGRLRRYGRAQDLLGDSWMHAYWQSEAHRRRRERGEKSKTLGAPSTPKEKAPQGPTKADLF